VEVGDGALENSASSAAESGVVLIAALRQSGGGRFAKECTAAANDVVVASLGPELEREGGIIVFCEKAEE
jgi:hypothetical protein